MAAVARAARISFTRGGRYASRIVLRAQCTWATERLPATTTYNCHPRSILKSLRYIHDNNSDNRSPLTIAELEFRISELERVTHQRRLTKYDVQNTALPLLYECASLSSEVRKYDTSSQCDKLTRAKIATRIIELCLIEVETRRVHLWDWLQNNTINKNNINSNDNFSSNENETVLVNVSNDNTYHDTTINTNNNEKFSPTAYWNDTPHPTKEMYSLVFVAWKHVVESYSYYSIKSYDAMQIMESSAKQTSALLLLMEEEYSSDSSFINAYNTNIPKGSYTLLRMGAILPDVRNYSIVIGTWGQCIDGSILRPKNYMYTNNSSSSSSSHSRDGSFQIRLKLEATAMKSMMELLEMMEEDLYENFAGSSSCSDDYLSTPTSPLLLSQRKRPPPDRMCYNTILSAMSRQVNPSLYEMRLVLQRMMERVKFELERPVMDDEVMYDDATNDDSSTDTAADQMMYDYAMTFFPDVFSYNALIEARANRSAMFASSSSSSSTSSFKNKKNEHIQPQQQHQFLTHRLQHLSAWQRHGKNENQLHNRKRRFTASEEEAILAEQIVDEMRHLATVTVRPNIYSYNAVIKAWVKTDSNRGLSRAVNYIHSLALNGQQQNISEQDGVSQEAKKGSHTVLERIIKWGASLLLSNTTDASQSPISKDGRRNIQSEKKNVNNQGLSNNKHHHAVSNVGITSRLNYLNFAGMGNTNATSITSSRESVEDENIPIGPMPEIEAGVTPDLKTFQIVISALERHGTLSSAKLSQTLLQILEEYYSSLNPDIAIYNSVLNAFARAAKEESDPRLSLASAQRADGLLCKLLRQDQAEIPRPNEYSFLLVINAWSNAASSAAALSFVDGNNAAQNAEILLKRLQMQTVGINKATIACYGAVIRTWASLGQSERALCLLEEMVDMSDRTLLLDPIHFNAVFDVCARDLASETDLTKVMSKLSRIHKILVQMESSSGYHSINVEPDTSSFNQVIRACYSPWTTPRGVQDDESIRQTALDIAHDCYTRMSKDYNSSHRPDAHTYAHMFKAVACLTPSLNITESTSEKYVLCKTIFHACCRDGHLTKSSLWTLRKMLSHGDEFVTLILSEMDNQGNLNKEKLLVMPDDSLFVSLPGEWSRNGRKHNALNRHRQ